MTESLEKLKSTVAELEAELLALHDADSLDRETRLVLEQAAAEILTAIERIEPGQGAPQSLLDHLRDATVQFEESHPTLTGILSRLIDGLAQMGI
jgi:hypothetical protein